LPTLSLLVDDHSRSAFSLFLVGSINHAHNIILLCKNKCPVGKLLNLNSKKGSRDPIWLAVNFALSVLIRLLMRDTKESDLNSKL
jgi:hypothetical protein